MNCFACPNGHNGGMVQAWSSQAVREAELPLLAAGEPLMALASRALATIVLQRLTSRRGQVAGARVVALVGSGNNGGDALHAAAYLARRGVAVEIVTFASSLHPEGTAAVSRTGARLLTAQEASPQRVASSDVVLDGVTGIGGQLGLREPAASFFPALASVMASGPHRPLIVAVDVPSGSRADGGAVAPGLLPADVTVAMGAAKPVSLLPPAAGLCGELVVVDLGLDLSAWAPTVIRLEAGDIAALWPVPQANSHKYTRGVVGIMAGSSAYPGAAVLATSAAVRTGVGMVRYRGPDDVAHAVLAAHPEVVHGSGRVQASVLGSGIGTGDLMRLAQVREALDAAVAAGEGVVADASALAILPPRVPASVVLTPHAGEMAALLSGRGESITRNEVEADPVAALQRAVDLTGATVLLKGEVTLVAGPGTPIYSQAEATPWLATAGAGDTLAGIIGALLAGHGSQVRANPAITAALAAAGASVHGRAARTASAGGPISATDVAQALPATIRSILQGESDGE